ncbi:DUF6879 family protein [Plantactinospora sp. WMMB782]|uniref:DUF6879 family protein n=1 Tax=Plantactinospora sp. WMMB782 TaxID=3404121 RepID=UPI003B923946
MGTPITNDEFGRMLREFETSAFRLELQPAYSEPTEHATMARFLAGDPQPPIEVPELRAWFDQIRRFTAEGKSICRVRVHEDPPTDYQRWERWIGQWNTEAGEDIAYLTRQQAYDIGLLPDAGDTDWWLLDDATLILMRFDGDGRRILNEVERDPHMVARARAWRDLAVHVAKRKGAPA